MLIGLVVSGLCVIFYCVYLLGMNIDLNDSIRMQKDMKGNNSGAAYLELKYKEDFDKVWKMDLKHIDR